MIFTQDQYCIVDNKPLSLSDAESTNLYCSKKCELQDSKFQTVKNNLKSGKLITYSTKVTKQTRETTIELSSDDEEDDEDQEPIVLKSTSTSHNNYPTNNFSSPIAEDENVFQLDDLNTYTYDSSLSASSASSVNSSRNLSVSRNGSLPSLFSDNDDYDEELYEDPNYDPSVEILKFEWLYDTPATHKKTNNKKNSDSRTRKNDWGYELSLANSSYNLKTKSILNTLIDLNEVSDGDDLNYAKNNYRLWLNQMQT